MKLTTLYIITQTLIVSSTTALDFKTKRLLPEFGAVKTSQRLEN